MDRETGFLAVELERALDSWHLSTGDHRWSARVRYLVRLLVDKRAWPQLVRRWEDADHAGDAEAALRVAWMLLDQGDQAGYRAALSRAARRGNLAALWIQHEERARAGADTTQLDEEYRRAQERQRQADELADQHGDANAAYRVGFRLVTAAEASRRRGDYSTAKEQADRGRAALRRATERGSPDAAVQLAALAMEEYPNHPEADQEREDRALPWYWLADELGHPSGSWHLGRILAKRGDIAAAEAAYRRAQARGSPWAVSSLASLLRRHDPPDLVGAEAAYRLAADIGYVPNAWTELGAFLREKGDLAGAEAAFQHAVQRGERNAATNLRYLYRHHPHLKPPPR